VPILVGTTAPTPETPVVPDPPLYDQATHVWTGWNGEMFPLSGDLRSMTQVIRGRTGMLEPKYQHQFVESATDDGAQWDGVRTLIREIGWPLFVHAGSSTALRVEHDRFLRTMQPDKLGVLTVGTPDGQRRYIQLRYSDGAEGDESGGSYGIVWIKHQLTMLAEQPYFYGDPISYTFGGPEGVNFYGGGVGTLGPPYHISSSRGLGSAVVSTPGDLPSWPVWTINGPMTSFTGVIGGKSITLPITLTLGQWIKVTTEPRVGTILDQTGTSRWPNAGAVTFGPVQPFADSALTLTIAGATDDTTVVFEFTPRWRRAW